AKKQNNGCNGYIDPTLCSINLIENRLFYLSYDPDARCNALFSINTDGTDRRLVCDLEGLDYLGLGAPQRLDYYRGKLYGYGLYQRVTGAEPEKGLSILCIDPQTGEGQVLYDLRGNYLSASLYYYGQYVYFCTFTVRGPSGSDVEIQRLDTGSLKTETVFSKSGVNGAWFAIKVVSENNIMLIPNALAEGTGQVVYSVTGGELTTAFEFGLQGITYPIEGGALCINRAEKQMEIRTNDGELIYKGDIDTGFLKEIGNNVSIEGESAVYGDTNLLLIVYSIYDPNDPDDDIGTCLVRYDLTQEDPKGELLIYSPWM
ncbi:MAG: hypothetical protein J5772_05780, partial [Clostridia bacterium]|nr:hypothetical protein [Clostridia bacterium]